MAFQKCNVLNKSKNYISKEVIEFIYATPIRLKLAALPSEKKLQFKELFTHKSHHIAAEDGRYGHMVSNVIHLRK
ncbi:MAG: hypothetical protein ACI9L9_001746 [Marivirga sp.]